LYALTRTLLTLVAIAAALLALPLVALGDGGAVIDDYNDNGQIDGCYTLAELDEASDLVGATDPQYGEIVDAIADARLTHVVAEEGQECPEGLPPATGDDPADDDGDDGGAGALIIVVGLIIVLAVGAGLLARSRRRG
jgi:hypothetical protein